MTTTGEKLRVGLIFGGRSVEHRVSLDSACAVMDHLDPKKYEVVPIGITREGAWLPGISPGTWLALSESANDSDVLEAEPTALVEATYHHLILNKPRQPLWPVDQTIDVVFPVLHGTYGEDGAIQGLLEMARVPYVGCGVLGSALGMDKEKMKMIFRSVGLQTVDSLSYSRQRWQRDPEAIMDAIELRLGYPCFVKPANGGSSIGVGKAYHRADLQSMIDDAIHYDSKIVIERAILCRELGCSVVGNSDPLVSVVGEAVTNHDFYDYHAKYCDTSSEVIIPADIPEEISTRVREQALQAFQALDLSGLARVDFFLERGTNQLYINEVNTLPSFTPQCMYPRLCEVSGLPYALLLDCLIELALERHTDRQRNYVSI
ncbi:MAG TPA: D-alanine--D-alanine ligase family protein [Ktedonobacteraceae bacterium]|nr:D-alanine--D-alanine ligase family protein [Ktedonobacteraceae bacterium]